MTEIEAETCANITLYAKWDEITYSIGYENLNGGTHINPTTYTIETDDIILTDAVRNGYTFEGWYSDAQYTQLVTEIEADTCANITLYAKWDIVTYPISYQNLNGGTHTNPTTYTIETEDIILADANLDGYTFEGWYSDENLTAQITVIVKGTTGNLTIYAKLTPIDYTLWLEGTQQAKTVVFNLNGGEGAISAKTVTETNGLDYPTNPQRIGYIFAGWYDNADCNGAMFDFESVITQDLTLYAKWIKLNTAESAAYVGSTQVIEIEGITTKAFIIVPLVSGLVTIKTTGSVDTYGILSIGGEVKKESDDISETDKNFNIVYYMVAGKVYTLTISGYSGADYGTATLKILGKATPDDGGKAVTLSNMPVVYGQSFTIQPPVRSGYSFVGYFDGSNVQYTDESGNSLKAWDEINGKVLYSKWEKIEYSITFNSNGGTSVDTVYFNYKDIIDINEYVTTMDGYSFDGWYLIDDAPFDYASMPGQSLILYAKWVKYNLNIKYENKRSISINDEKNAELFNATCIDTDGKKIDVSVSSDGEIAAGNIVNIILSVASKGVSKQVTIPDVKVYGNPTITYDDEIDYINISDTLSADHFGAYGTDTFGNATQIFVFADGQYSVGDTVTVIIQIIDTLGNTAEQEIPNVKVYGNPTITYDTAKTCMKVTDSINNEFFGVSAVDTFGSESEVNTILFSGTKEPGNTITVRITAVDCKNNTTQLDIDVKVYGNPTISDPQKTNFKETETGSISLSSIGIIAKDSHNNFAAEISLQKKDSTQPIVAGETIALIVTAVDCVGNTSTKEISIKIYGTPTLTCTDSIKVGTELNATNLNAKARDSFGNALDFTITLKSGDVNTAGQYIVVTLSASDILGNTATVDFNVGVYSAEDISLDYNSIGCDRIKLTSKGEELSVWSSDSFGNICQISVKRVVDGEYYPLIAAQIQDIVIIATDKAGNQKVSDVLTGFKVYDAPTISFIGGEFIIQQEILISEIAALFEAKDSFGGDISFDYNLIGPISATNRVTFTVTAEDVVGNKKEETYIFAVVSSNYALVQLYVDGQLYDEVFVSVNTDYTLPVIDNENFEGWVGADWKDYTDASGNSVKHITSSASIVKLHAKTNGEFLPIWLNSQLSNLYMNGNYYLTCDLNLGGVEWTPIGDSYSNFRGMFDGNGFKIYNFKVTSTDKKYVGFFGYNSGEIINLRVEDFVIDVSYSAFIFNVGGLAGYNEGEIANCHAEGSLSAVVNGTSYVQVGGLVGLNSTTGKIINCSATAEVYGSSPYDPNVGCLVGKNEGTIINCFANGTADANCTDSSPDIGGLVGRNEGIISNSYATGDVSATSTKTNGAASVGGLVGYNQNIINDCFATGNVSVSAYFAYGGGLVAINTGMVLNSYATGNINLKTNNFYSYAGGLLGNNNGIVNNCYRYEGQIFRREMYEVYLTPTNTLGNAASLDSLKDIVWAENNLLWEMQLWVFDGENFPANIDYANYLAELDTVHVIANRQDLLALQGRFLLYNYELIADIDLNGQEWIPIVGINSTFEGNGHVISSFMITTWHLYSGLFGCNNGIIKNLGIDNFTIDINYSSISQINVGGMTGFNRGEIINCFAVGDVSATTRGNSYVGGLVGYNNIDSTINNSYAIGTVISNCSSIYSCAGGLVGYNYFATIRNCYAMGSATATTSLSASAGGLIGYVYGGWIYNCYATGNATSTGSSTAQAGGLLGFNYNCKIYLKSHYLSIGLIVM